MTGKGLHPKLALVLLLQALSAPTEAASLRSIHLFDGGHFAVPDHPDFAPSGGFTIQAWVRRMTSTGYQTILGKDAGTAIWLGLTPGGKVRLHTRGFGTQLEGNGTIPLERWTHIAVTYDGSALRRYYINGSLDFESSLHPGPVGRSSAPLRIGADESGFPFTGFLDDVRFWNRALDSWEVRLLVNPEMDHRVGLEAAWSCDSWSPAPGVLRDPHGNHDGTGVPPFEFHPHFASLRVLHIPMTRETIVIDGLFDAIEYGSGEQVIVDHAYFPRVYIVHDGDDLYVSIPRIPRGASTLARAQVLIDARGEGIDPIGADQYRFSTGMDGQELAERGNESGKFEETTLPAGNFEAAVTTGEFDWSAELRIRRTAIGHPDSWGPLRIAFVASSIDEPGDDHAWPPLTGSRLPSTWARTGFTTAWTLTVHTFPGIVLDRLGRGMAGASLDLYTSHSGLLTLVGSETTRGDGRYQLTFTGQPPEAFLVMEHDPPGTYSLAAEAGDQGTAIHLNLLQYPARASSNTYSSATFTEAIGLPPGDFLDRHVIIIYPSPVTRADLAPFADWKRRLGFHVEEMSVEEIAASSPGRDLAEKIRNRLRARWESLRPQPVYALLIGRGDVLPVRPIAWSLGDPDEYSIPGGPRYHPKIPSEWYYADLDSDWDPDGDSLFGEGLNCGSADPPCWDRPERVELPRGLSSSSEDDWEPEISVARLGLNLPGEVRSALGAAMAAEMSGSSVKRRALLAGAFWGFEGRSWDREEGRYFEPGDDLEDGGFLSGAIERTWDGEKPFGRDTAEHLEPALGPILEPHFDEVFRLYEATSPGNRIDLIPTRQPFDLPLGFDALNEAWTESGFGLVNLEGHGDPNGIYHDSWIEDWNANGRIEQPADPSETGGDCPVEPPNPMEGVEQVQVCRELGGAAFLSSRVGVPLEVPPVVFANACGTGAVAWVSDGRDEVSDDVLNLRYGPEALAGTLPRNGKAAAWIGSMGVIPTGHIDAFQDAFNRDLVTVPICLGDAFWSGMADLSRANIRFDWRLLTPALFGDPTASYWGNPADMRSPWPQSGRDWRATSSAPFSGPRTGRLLWVTLESNILTPPVVETAGTLLVGRSSRFSRFRSDGILDASFGEVSSYPHQLALTTDGIYAVTGAVFKDHDAGGAERYEAGIATGTGSVRVGPDGVVWVPTISAMARGVGGRFQTLPGGRPNGPAAFTPEGHAVWSAGTRLWYHEVDRRGNVETRSHVYPSDLTPPAVGPDGRVYVGVRSLLYGVVRETGEGWRYSMDDQVRVRPTIGGNGAAYRVYAVSDSGRIHCVNPEGERIWTRSVGHPVQASMALDGSRLYVPAGEFLLALDASSGSLEWQVHLEGLTGPMSSPVIAAGRRVYVLRADGRLVAVGEDRSHMGPEAVEGVPLPGGAFEVTWRDRSLGETGFLVESCSADGACKFEGQAAAGKESMTVGGILPGQPVYFRVRTLDTDGGGGAVEGSTAGDYSYSRLVIALPPVPEPPSLPAAEAASARSMRIRWQYPGDRNTLLGFEVTRRKNETAEEVVAGEAGPGASALIDGGLEPGTKYTYTIIAFNAAGRSAPSSPAIANTKAIALATPSDFAATYAEAAIRLSWKDLASGETGYVLERQVEGAADHEPVAVLPAGAQSYVDRQGLASARYEYRVKAVAPLGESDPALANVLFGGQSGPVIPSFRRGDANSDKVMDISDPLATLNYLFLGTTESPCQDAMDSNDDGVLDIADGIHALAYLFLGGAGPPPPGPESCAPDPTMDDLPECRYSCS